MGGRAAHDLRRPRGVGPGSAVVPLTPYQETIARLLASNRSFDSYLAGGAAIHIEANSTRYSNDLDYFHDSTERLAEAFAEDAALLERNGHQVSVDLRLPGYIRAVVSHDGSNTKVEWAHDSSWRFMPTIRHEVVGYTLHPIDLATNKLLALAGRDEPRDFLDILDLHRRTLPLGALCWAAAGKDPGYTPLALLEILRRRGKYHPDDFARLRLTEPVDLPALKGHWLAALAEADAFIRSRPPSEVGCLYYSRRLERFVVPGEPGADDAVLHYGRPGGVLPRVIDAGS
jgi:hypothetical protein